MLKHSKIASLIRWWSTLLLALCLVYAPFKDQPGGLGLILPILAILWWPLAVVLLISSMAIATVWAAKKYPEREWLEFVEQVHRHDSNIRYARFFLGVSMQKRLQNIECKLVHFIYKKSANHA